MQKQFLNRRKQMAFVGVGLWVLLAFWSLSAFWGHIDSLKENYQLAAKCGAMGGEFALLALVLWHCFDKHIGVRRWALILGFMLAVVILVHAGALRGSGEAKQSRIDTENRLTEKLTQMSKDQSAGLAASNAQASSGVQSQRERLVIAGKTTAQQGEIAKAAQETIASEIVKSDAAVKDNSILPVWYLNGWCYSVIFIVSLAFVGIIFLMMMNTEDIDADFDGIPDRDQQPNTRRNEQREPRGSYSSDPTPVNAQSNQRPAWRGGQRVGGSDTSH